MKSSTFEVLDERGHEVERIVALQLLDAGWIVELRHAMQRYDLFARRGNSIHLLEIKNEEDQSGTGNICIETTQKKAEPSGISTSEATVWVHYFGNVCVLYRTQKMRMFLKEHGPGYRWGTFGDRHNRCVLVPRKDLIDTAWATECETLELGECHLLSD